MEDGSSGGNGGTTRGPLRSNDPDSPANSRQLNTSYLGEYDDAIDLETI